MTIWTPSLGFFFFPLLAEELLWVQLSQLEDNFLIHLLFPAPCSETRTCVRLGGCMERCRKMDSTFFHSNYGKSWVSGSHWRLQQRTNMNTNTFSFFVSKISIVVFRNKGLYMRIAWKFYYNNEKLILQTQWLKSLSRFLGPWFSLWIPLCGNTAASERNLWEPWTEVRSNPLFFSVLLHQRSDFPALNCFLSLFFFFLNNLLIICSSKGNVHSLKWHYDQVPLFSKCGTTSPLRLE